MDTATHSITVQVFVTYTVGEDGSVTAETNIGDPDLEFVTDDLADEDAYETFQQVDRVLAGIDHDRTRLLEANGSGFVSMTFHAT